MPKVKDTRLVNLPRKQVYKELMDIEQYPKFIPFVQKVRIVEKEENITVADLKIGFGPVGFSYRCRIAEKLFEEIHIKDISGPFEFLEAKLTFEEKEKNSTLVGYYFSSQFKSRTMNKISDPIFNQSLKSFLSGVEKYLLRKKR